MIGPLSRILARWLAASLVTLGYFSPETAEMVATDPDVVMLIGAGIGLLTEVGYAIAKRNGWNT